MLFGCAGTFVNTQAVLSFRSLRYREELASLSPQLLNDFPMVLQEASSRVRNGILVS